MKAPSADLDRHLQTNAETRVKLLGLASLDMEANPSYDRRMADRLAEVGMDIAALTPNQLAQWLATVIS